MSSTFTSLIMITAAACVVMCFYAWLVARFFGSPKLSFQKIILNTACWVGSTSISIVIDQELGWRGDFSEAAFILIAVIMLSSGTLDNFTHVPKQDLRKQ